MWLCRKKYLQLQAAILVLQRYYRGYKARKFTLELKRNNAVSNHFRIFIMYNILLITIYTFKILDHRLCVFNQ